MTFRLRQPVVRTWNAEQIARLQELASHSDKLSASQIANRMKWPSRNAVIGACRRFGIQLQRTKKSYDPNKPHKPKAQTKRTNFNFDRPTFKREPFKARDVECEPLHLTLAEKEDSQCSFPYGDGPFTFCCHPVVEGYSYCEAHKELCLVKPIKPAKSFIPARGRAA
jgi:hypothetical protein